GKGGRYLFVPPRYTGGVPANGYFVQKPRTNGLLIILRAFVQGGDTAAAVRGVKATAKIYPLSAAAKPPATTFINTSGLKYNHPRQQLSFLRRAERGHPGRAGRRVRPGAGWP